MEEKFFKLNESYRFDISISDRCYDHKPTDEDYHSMSFHVENLSADELIDRIKSGHSVCHVFKNNRRTKKNFLYTSVVFIDIDDSPLPMKVFLEGCVLKPSIAYTTSSNGVVGKGFRYRLIFVLDKKIKSEMLYKSLYSYITDQINLRDTKDDCGSICNQLMNGNTKIDIETYCSNVIYSFNSSFFSKWSSEYTTPPPPRVYSNDHSEKQQIYNAQNLFAHNGDEMIADDEIINLLMQDPRAFLDYCEGHIEIISESKIEYNENGYGFYPDDYFCLFYRYNWKEKKIIKFKDHEKRRNRLYIDACIMRRIKPDITFQELLYNLVLRRQRYYDNSDGVLTNKFLIDQARKVLSAESSKIQSLNPCKHGLYRVDKDYCQRIGMTPRSYSRVVAGKIRFQEIAKWYDYNKSLSDNLVYAKANGIKVSRKTL